MKEPYSSLQKIYSSTALYADYAGLYNYNPPKEPTSTKFRIGYIISIAGCYLLCKSLLQSTIALSTSESHQVARAMPPIIIETIPEFIKHLDLVGYFICIM